jgi:hypothetical protein
MLWTHDPVPRRIQETLMLKTSAAITGLWDCACRNSSMTFSILRQGAQVPPFYHSFPRIEQEEQICNVHREAILSLLQQCSTIFTWRKRHVEISNKFCSHGAKLHERELLANTTCIGVTLALRDRREGSTGLRTVYTLRESQVRRLVLDHLRLAVPALGYKLVRTFIAFGRWRINQLQEACYAIGAFPYTCVLNTLASEL